MTIAVNPDANEMKNLHDELKAYEAQLASYLASTAGQADPHYANLTKADIQLNLNIYNLSIAQLQLAGADASAAVDSINNAVSSLSAMVANKNKIATDLNVVKCVVTFVVALLSENPSGIVNAGGSLLSTLKNG